MSILDEIKQTFKAGTYITKLIYINIAVFLFVNITGLIFFFFGIDGTAIVIDYLAVPSGTTNLLLKPWTPITYMFLHEGFLHLLFNMLFLFWFGQMLVAAIGQKKLLSIYLLGGLSGAALYILAYNALPVFQIEAEFSKALGASASVMAIMVAIAVFQPNYQINLLFIGPVKLKYIALVYFVLDILSIQGSNAGGHIAHLGGAIFGFLYIQQYKKGKNIAKGFDNFLEGIFSWFRPKPKMRVTHKSTKKMSDQDWNRNKHTQQEEIDRILDKISKSGYSSLTKSEKETLFRASKN